MQGQQGGPGAPWENVSQPCLTDSGLDTIRARMARSVGFPGDSQKGSNEGKTYGGTPEKEGLSMGESQR